MSIVELKAQARQALHNALAAPASYTEPGVGGETYPTVEQQEAGLSLTARWHTKMRIQGERDSSDVGILEGVNRLVFNTDELAALGIELERLGEVIITGYDKTFRLDYHEDSDGPLNDYWSVIALDE
jgi:hypothetical protein